MTPTELWTEIDSTLAEYDLLKHPFYQAWSMGELTHENLAFYGAQYLAQVGAFPAYLTALHSRMPEGAARRRVLANAAEEEIHGRSHADIWRQFIAGMGGDPGADAELLPEIRNMVETFRGIARNGSVPAALGAFYAYESQIPRVAEEKLAGLKTRYGADDAACEYFALHRYADVKHARVWQELINESAAGDGDTSAACAEALAGVRSAAKALWGALDGIERVRTSSLN